MATSVQITFDCTDPNRLATFWADVLGYQVQPPPAGFASWEAFMTAQGIPEEAWPRVSAIIDSAGHGPRIFFQHVPEPKMVKNRVHLDVNVGAGITDHATRRACVDAAAERLLLSGASQVRAVEQHGEYWIVMQDPEGNEFCLQ
ncbi:MAG: VOC family protein [Chloroflexaceae bacterium]|nr:VOC family protein [Chloroflexaceae bacterium]